MTIVFVSVHHRSLVDLGMCNNDGIIGDAAQQLVDTVLAHPMLETFNEVPMRLLRDDAITEVDVSGKGVDTAGRWCCRRWWRIASPSLLSISPTTTSD